MSTDLAILSSHLSTLIEARSVSQHELDPLVAYAILETQDGRTSDTRRAQWEYLLKNEVFKLAATEGDALKKPEPSYFDELKSRLDLVLAFTEHDVCDVSFPFSVLEDLLETQTVASCWHIFSWIEERTERLTTNMIPAKGKSLVLLRTLNDLLRRLSKTGKNTMFCGRILIFLSSVFSLGERSGVNLRGDYGPQWEGVVPKKREAVPTSTPVVVEGKDVKMTEPDKDVEKPDGHAAKLEEQAKPPASEKTEEEKRDEFFQTFWSLQLPFSRPPLFAHMISFESFKDSVNAVLPVIAEATKKERAMMGSKVVTGNLKRKREPSPHDVVDDAGRDYFFAKFLTSPELLDLEIADTLFRRQFLFQLLILLQHMLHFTQSEKAKWAVPRNRSLHMDFTLSADDAKWAQDTWAKAMDELRATTPNGKSFADTVASILEREWNWMKWKNDLCPPFDKEPIQPTLEEQTRGKRQALMEPPTGWRFRWGTEALTEIWETGFHSIRDCESHPEPGELKDFAKRLKQNDARIEMRKKQLARLAHLEAPSAVSPEAWIKPTTSLESVSSQPSQSAPSQASQPAPSQISQAAAPQASQPAPSQTSQPAYSQPAVSTTSSSQAAVSQPVGSATPAAPVPTPPTGPASLHPSLPPRPVVSPAPFAKPQTPNRHAAPPSGPDAPTPAVVKAVTLPPLKQDPQLVKLAEQKDRLSWLALRRARIEHLHLFGKIGPCDVEMLMANIDQEKEKEAKGGKTEKLEAPVSAPVGRNGSSPVGIRANGINGNGDNRAVEAGSKPELQDMPMQRGPRQEPPQGADHDPEARDVMEVDSSLDH